ncbi:hypothetical protein [Burkholderia sp. 22PA0106]|uniref:hypothetical protein n=1 Tax=Burkholderia sp. 22PA0106 TaxID=3237371 RepID=UPI0039C02622
MTLSRLRRLLSVHAIRACLLMLPALVAAPTHAAEPATPAQLGAALSALLGHPAPLPDGDGQVVLAPWPHAPAGSGDAWVVAALLPAPNGDHAPDLWAGVLSRQGDGFRLLASSTHGAIDDFSWPIWHPSLQLDLIPYPLSANDTAFGVRVLDDYTSTAHSDAYAAIRLYHLNGAALAPVFDALTSMSSYDKDEAAQCVQHATHGKHDPTEAQQADCDADATTSGSYLLAFSPAQTRGHFDLLVRTRPAKGQPPRLVKRAKWDGNGYQPRVFDGG